jgi:hypothetical protein
MAISGWKDSGLLVGRLSILILQLLHGTQWERIFMDVCLWDWIQKKVPHLRLVSERLGFSINPGSYNVIPEYYSQFIVPYRVPPTNISLEFEGIQIYDKESCSSCLSTLMLFLRRFKDDMEPYRLSDGKFNIAIGKGVCDAADGTVFVANCMRFMQDKGIWVKGCPLVPTRIYESITDFEPVENEPEIQ